MISWFAFDGWLLGKHCLQCFFSINAGLIFNPKAIYSTSLLIYITIKSLSCSYSWNIHKYSECVLCLFCEIRI